LGYGIFSIAFIKTNAKTLRSVISDESQSLGLLSSSVRVLPAAKQSLHKEANHQIHASDVMQSGNFAKSTAHFFWESVPVIYGWGPFRSVAQRFKQQFNENSKSPAKWEYFAELNHNEIVGWSGKGEQCKQFSVVFIRDPDGEPHEIECRIDITKAIIQSAGLVTFDLEVQGMSRLAKMLSTVVVGDFMSVYFGVERDADPSPVSVIDLFKNTLKENGVRDDIVEQLEKV
jgi:glucose/mannose-6-phosphate isomerase